MIRGFQGSDNLRLQQGRIDRRDFLSFAKYGIGSTALASLLLDSGRTMADSAATTSLSVSPHFAPKATRVIHIVLCGGLSHIDTFDYKPELEKRHGQTLGGSDRPDVFFGKVGLLRKNDWAFHQRGQSGLWISELFPHLAELADELTIIRSMFADTSNHTPATFQENTGFRLNGFPVFGSWASYGLGCETEDLPAFVVIPDTRGVPAGGSINWTSGFLPARHQGVVIRSKGTPIDDIQPAKPIRSETEVASRTLLAVLNQRHADELAGGDVFAARMRSYELAAKMQLAVPDVADLGSETAATHSMYGLDQAETADFARGCLLTRRLLEKGVRFVQVFSGGAFGSPRINWDGHENMKQNHGQEARRIDKPIAGLLRDLRQRGMLQNTLVLFTSEFGRTPFTQSEDGVLGEGRDHNQYGFSGWLCGAGLKPGLTYGATDELGLKAEENPVHWNDFHATVLHLLGIDHEQLTHYHNGIRRRLTDVAGHVLTDLLA